jgi:hypothetical protein
LEARLIANSAVAQIGDQDFSHLDGDPCWLWLGAIDRRGYGKLNMWIDKKHRQVKAHRASLMVFAGMRLEEIPIAMHLCNTPACINPGHLDSGTQSENLKYCHAAGRSKNTFGSFR